MTTRLFTLLSCLIAGAVFLPSLRAQEQTVFLQGYQVTQDHVVFGSVDHVSGARATINLGYAHGVRTGDSFLCVRSVDSAMVPVSGLSVLRVEPGWSHTRIEGPFRVRKGDFVLIRADRLDLWDGKTRFEQLVRKRFVASRRSRGYNTLSPDPELWNEIGRDDSYQRRQYIAFDQSSFIRESERKAGDRDTPVGSILPLTVLRNEETDDEGKPAQQVAAVHIEVLSLFLTAAKNEASLVSRLENDRLFQLDLLDQERLVTEFTAPLYRRLLLGWTNKVLTTGRKVITEETTEEPEDSDVSPVQP